MTHRNARIRRGSQFLPISRAAAGGRGGLPSPSWEMRRANRAGSRPPHMLCSRLADLPPPLPLPAAATKPTRQLPDHPAAERGRGTSGMQGVGAGPTDPALAGKWGLMGGRLQGSAAFVCSHAPAAPTHILATSACLTSPFVRQVGTAWVLAALQVLSAVVLCCLDPLRSGDAACKKADDDACSAALASGRICELPRDAWQWHTTYVRAGHSAAPGRPQCCAAELVLAHARSARLALAGRRPLLPTAAAAASPAGGTQSWLTLTWCAAAAGCCTCSRPPCSWRCWRARWAGR